MAVEMGVDPTGIGGRGARRRQGNCVVTSLAALIYTPLFPPEYATVYEVLAAGGYLPPADRIIVQRGPECPAALYLPVIGPCVLGAAFYDESMVWFRQALPALGVYAHELAHLTAWRRRPLPHDVEESWADLLALMSVRLVEDRVKVRRSPAYLIEIIRDRGIRALTEPLSRAVRENGLGENLAGFFEALGVMTIPLAIASLFDSSVLKHYLLYTELGPRDIQELIDSAPPGVALRLATVIIGELLACTEPICKPVIEALFSLLQ